MLQWIGLTKEDELAQEIDEDWIPYVRRAAHDLFVHRLSVVLQTFQEAQGLSHQDFIGPRREVAALHLVTAL